ncbi:glycosyltransferase family 2 protein [Desulfovibrio ferrophilus]|uniref:Glycosyl transferase family 2 n=1 Tax=Desulfovibrio ferrophilus TaxID=241368 RepID=A0A2Z6AX52_9BACT|nr:glycosyltransferase family A protein [Desulfovibrio ferrophilus]BBD07829.1 glycosyl transferase family 2 [Desulfovibrio ferrophilus]
MKPLVSIVISNYEYGHYLPALFNSLASQTLGLMQVEVIVADDGSSDGSADTARTLGAALGFSRFKVIALKHRGKPGPVRNAGLSIARGRYLLCLDPDDAIEPGFLSRTVAALDNCPEASLAYTDYFEATGDGGRVVSLPDFDAKLLQTQNPLTLATLMRREVFERSRGFSDQTAYEDWDFWVQAAENGFKGIRVPLPLFRYNHHGSNFSWKARLVDGRAKAQIVLDNKYFFDPEVVGWARALVRSEAWAVPFRRGLIPRGADVLALREMASRVLDRESTRRKAANA